jgi:hypothetical protein
MAKPTLDLRPNSTNETEIDEEIAQSPARSGGSLSHGQIYLEWEAPEYVIYKKTTVWYIGFGVMLALLLSIAFIMQSFLTGIIFLLSGILIFFHSERPPKIVSYDLRTTGIRIDSRIYLYRELSAFNIVEHGSSIYLLLKSKRLLMPLIHIPLADNLNHEEVLDAISNHLPQDPDFVEPLADVLAHWLGF